VPHRSQPSAWEIQSLGRTAWGLPCVQSLCTLRLPIELRVGHGCSDQARTLGGIPYERIVLTGSSQEHICDPLAPDTPQRSTTRDLVCCSWQGSPNDRPARAGPFPSLTRQTTSKCAAGLGAAASIPGAQLVVKLHRGSDPAGIPPVPREVPALSSSLPEMKAFAAYGAATVY